MLGLLPSRPTILNVRRRKRNLVRAEKAGREAADGVDTGPLKLPAVSLMCERNHAGDARRKGSRAGRVGPGRSGPIHRSAWEKKVDSPKSASGILHGTRRIGPGAHRMWRAQNLLWPRRYLPSRIKSRPR